LRTLFSSRPLGYLSSSSSTVWSTNSNTRKSRFFFRNTSIKLTRLSCRNCWNRKSKKICWPTYSWHLTNLYLFLELNRNTELHVAWPVALMMAWAKRICILMISVTVFSKRNRKHVTSFYKVRETPWRFGRTWKSNGNAHLLACVPTATIVLTNFHLCLYNSTET